MSASSDDIADGLNWAWQYAGSDVITNSWASVDCTTSQGNNIEQAIANAVNLGRGGKGTVVVFAAGNSSVRDSHIIGPVCWPGRLSTVIAVGAIDRQGAPTDYSPEGPELAMVAPSGHYTGSCLGEVVTTDRFGAPGCNDGPGGDINFTTTFSGTSAAAPQVAAVAGLLLSLEPNLTVAQVRSRLSGAADSWGTSTIYGAGKLNAYRTVYTPPPLTITLNGPSSVKSASTCLWTATPTNGVAPYTYTWYVNNFPVNNGSSSPQELIYQNSGSAFTITVQVRDAVTASGSNSKNVSISGSAPICQF